MKELLIFIPHEYYFDLRTEVSDAEIAAVRYALTAVWDKYINHPTVFNVRFHYDLPPTKKDSEPYTSALYLPNKDQFVFFMVPIRRNGIALAEIVLAGGHEAMHKVQKEQGKRLIHTEGEEYLKDENELEATRESLDLLKAYVPALTGEFYIGNPPHVRVVQPPKTSTYPGHTQVAITG